MTKALLIFIGVLLHTTLWAQYTYFNSQLGPLGGVEAGNGVSSQLMITNDSIVHVAVYPNSGEHMLSFNVQNMEGEFIHHAHNPTFNGYYYLNRADAISHYEGGYLYAGKYTNGGIPTIMGFGPDFMKQWEIQVPIFYDDNDEPVFNSENIYGSFLFARPLSDGGFVVAGPMTYNFSSDQHYQNLWMQRYDANHELVWNIEYPFYNDGVIPVGKRFLMANDLFEMPNGDLLLWGCWYHAIMPMVLRFDSEGNFLGHTSWGAPGPTDTLDDWLPWPVQTDDEEFLFAYKYGTIFENFVVQFGKPRIGHFDAATMEVTLFDPIDREAKFHYLNDFAKAVGGGYVALGYGTIPDPENPDNSNFDISFAYLLKVNEQGEEIWYHEYLPPVDHITPKVYDLEVTPDGGYAFVGDFRLVEDGELSNEQRQWVVKTDACGELEYNGCEAVVNTTEIQHHTTPDILVWPNPTSGMLNIQLSVANATQIEVFDIRGQTVYHHSFPTSQKELTLDLSHLTPGLYGVRVISTTGIPLGYTKVLRH